jgi:hypothetical protein
MKSTVPTARLCDTKAERDAAVRRTSKLRPIDAGTSYDATGKLRRLIHKIEKGEYGHVTNMVCAIRTIENGRAGIRTVYTGKSTMDTLHFMASRLAKEMIE